MSKDSSEINRTKPSRKWWLVFKPKSEWGIIVGIVVSLMALIAPVFLLNDILAWLAGQVFIDSNIESAVFSTAYGATGVAIIVAALAAYDKRLSDLGLRKPTWLHLARAVVAFVVYITISVLLQTAVHAIFGENYNAGESQELGFYAPEGWGLLTVFIPLVIVAPFVEEIIFRGFMFKGVRRKVPFWVAALVVSALFGLVHGQWNVGLDVFAMSMISCYLVEKTGSLWPSIFLHIIKNGLAFYLVYIFKAT